jgi:hypothetical protein
VPGQDQVRKALQDIRNHLREDIQKVDEPQLKAMFETSAEVLGGLEKGLQGLRAEERKGLALIMRSAADITG